MHDFEYCVPDNLQEAVNLISIHRGAASLLAGGTDLILLMRASRKRPNLVIDIKKISELTRIELGHSELYLGAAVPCRRVYENQEVAKKLSGVVDSTKLIGGIQVQGRGTVGGNLCNASPSADTIPTLIAYGAKAHIVSAQKSRNVPVEEICLGPGKTSIEEDEILVNLTIPVPPRNSGAKFLRFTPRNEMDISVANAAAWVELDESGQAFKSARIAIGAVAPTPLFVESAGKVMLGQSVNDDVIREAANIAQDAATPITDMRGTAEHRNHLVKVLVTRAIKAAVQRARGENV